MDSAQPPPPRYSSPFGPVKPTRSESARPIADNSQMKQQTLMNWVEPSVAPAKPSFEEAGLQRHGVVANMAALGTLPSAKVMKAAAKSDLIDNLGRDGMVKKSGASSVSATPSASFTTPEPTTNPPRRHSLPSAVPELEKTTPPPGPIPADPIVAAPLPLPVPRTPSQQTSPRPLSQGQAYGQSVFALQKPIPINVPRPVPQPVAPPPMLNGDINLGRTDKVVEMAVQLALDARRWPTAYALRTLYDDHRLNPRMVRLIDAIYEGRADIDQEREFKAVMTHKKKEGKKGRMGEYYFNGDGSDPLPPPRPAQFSTVNAQTPSQGTPSGRSVTGGRSMSDAQAFNMSASPYKDLSEPSTHHVSKKHKGNDFQPPSDLELDGNEMPQQPPAQQNGDATPNSTEQARSRSNSTTSSLSSVDDAVLRSGNLSNTASPLHKTKDKDSSSHGGLGGLGGGAHTTQASPRFAAHANANTTSAASAETHPSIRNQRQPINATQKPGPKSFTFSTVNSSSPAAGALPSSTNNPANAKSSHQRHSSSTTSAAMAPAALLPPSSSSSSSKISSPQLPPSAVFKTKKDPSKALARPHEENDRSHLKRDAERKRGRENPHPVRESFVRHQVPLPESESVSDGGDSIAAGTSKRPTLKLFNKKTRQSQAANYDSDTLSSPTVLSFQPDIAPGSLSVSRAGTPNNFRPTRKPKTGTGLRVKTSPMKKKGGGTLAGIPRASGERNSPTGNGAFSNGQDDNDDYCSSCGGNGDLVCCDGCARSFHFKCVDPPMSEGSLPDEWFCNVCFTARLPRRETGGSFGSLLANLERKNPSAFHLPKDIREYFENVKTGTEGEYEEGAPPKAKQRAGYDEQPDYFKLKDSKGKTIFCHQCQGAASAPDRAIIPCTFCGLSWHLDCLDVPMAKEPAPGKPWRCPAHIDDLLTVMPGVLAPAHRFRKIKGASVIKPAVSRGVKNNGHIEIENEPTDDEQELGFYEQREYGRIYKLPELGIKLDFIAQVRRMTGGGYALPPPPRRRARSPPPTGNWNEHTLADQQAALNLASLAIPAPEIGDASILINGLLAKAPENATALIATGDAKHIATRNLALADKKTLIAFKALIDDQLAGLESMESAAAHENSPAVSDAQEIIPDVATEPAEEVQMEVEIEGDKDVEMSD